MELFHFYIKAFIYILSFLVSFYGLRALNYEKLIKANHVTEARILYALLIMGLAYVVGSFLIQFLYMI
ncbi:MAG: DUF1146 domain-containing protein [Solobacterium sp.]|nr:DUF1146 domain-containing protein [Solobacterium sp.]